MECFNCFERKLISKKKHPLEESGCVLYLTNKNITEAVNIVKIDCTNSPIQGKRCDFAVYKNEQNVLFIELKGSDINTAFKQIENTLNYFKSLLICNKKSCYIVHSGSPKIDGSTQTRKSKLIRSHKAHLEIIKSGAEVNV